MKEETTLETIKVTLRRIYELSERGVGGEKESAKTKLQTLLQKHNLTLEELISPATERVRFEWKHEFERKLLIQIICMVKNVHTYSSWKVPRKPRAQLVELTPAEAIDVRRFYEHYRRAMERQMEEFFSAFLHRNRLFSDAPSDRDVEGELTPQDIARLKRLAQMVQSLEPSPAPRALLKE